METRGAPLLWHPESWGHFPLQRLGPDTDTGLWRELTALKQHHLVTMRNKRQFTFTYTFPVTNAITIEHWIILHDWTIQYLIINLSYPSLNQEIERLRLIEQSRNLIIGVGCWVTDHSTAWKSPSWSLPSEARPCIGIAAISAWNPPTNKNVSSLQQAFIENTK